MVLDEAKKGSLLLSEPFMHDPNFKRSVVILCEHNDDGTFGLILNQQTEYSLSDAVHDLDSLDAPLYRGGPVEPDTLHFLHNRPDLFEDCIQVSNQIYWGGNFERLKFLISTKQINNSNIRFFIGYSGWEKNQLKEEVSKKSWIIADGNNIDIFVENDEQLWRNVMKDLGGEFKAIAHFPEDPSLN